MTGPGAHLPQRGASFRGQPLLLLALVLLGWTGLRVAFWEGASPATGGGGVTIQGPDSGSAPAPLVAERALPTGPAPAAAPAWPFVAPAAVSPPVPGPLSLPVAEPLPAGTAVMPLAPPAAPALAPVAPRVAAGHNLLLLAGLANLEIPPAILAYLQPGADAAAKPALLPAPVPAAVSATARGVGPVGTRWSADGWLMLRQDSASPLLSGRPGYGRSQMGAVLRYRLNPASSRAPQVYLRASRALAGPAGGVRESEGAVGLSVRPVAAVPLRAAAEMRLAQTDRGTRASPAAYAVTELPPVELPLNLRGEVYVQGGYVGGDYATPFIDGQARVDRGVVAARGVQLRAGGGAWGGAQRGAARLDVGPSAALTFRVGDTQGRVAADYRFRVAGSAEPSSGPAITLSAGF